MPLAILCIDQLPAARSALLQPVFCGSSNSSFKAQPLPIGFLRLALAAPTPLLRSTLGIHIYHVLLQTLLHLTDITGLTRHQIFCWGREEVIRILWVAILLKERYECVEQGLMDRQERNGKQRRPTKASDRGSQDRRLLSLPLRGHKASLLSSSLCVPAPLVICIQLSTFHMHLAPYQLLNFHCT